MVPYLCAFCLFTFPQPDADDRNDVKRAIESQEQRPWSEMAGPYASIERLVLLTPDLAIADAVLTIVIDGINLRGPLVRRSRFVLVRQTDGRWQVVSTHVAHALV